MSDPIIISYDQWVDNVTSGLEFQIEEEFKGSEAIPCATCEGTGIVTCEECDGWGTSECGCCGNEIPCDTCDGEGELACEECNGTGVVAPDGFIDSVDLSRSAYDNQCNEDRKKWIEYQNRLTT